ncbi:MAG: ABC transporter permease [Gammaproteobacteria bacterium]
MLTRSWLWFRRGLRRELRLPLATLTLAAAAAGGVALFSGQLERTVLQAADGALGADLVVSASSPLPDSLKALAARLDLTTTTVVTFPTVAVAGEHLKLASVSAVHAPYPLRGTVQLRTRVGAPMHIAAGIPSPGTIWASPGLAAALDRKPGDSLSLGKKTFRLGALIARAPGSELDLASIAPILIMNTADLPATGLAGTQSRLDYELLLAGTPDALTRFRTASKSLLPSGAQLQDVNDITPGLSGPLDGTRDFLRLAVLATLLIAAAALIQSARYYLDRQRAGAAILKTLGASRGTVYALYALELLWLTLAASAAGIVVGWGIARGLGALAAHWFNLAVAPAPLSALAVAPITAALLAAGLWLVPVFALPRARPALTLRGAVPDKRHTVLQILAAVIALAILILWRGADSMTLTLWTLAAAAALAAFIGGLGYALVKLLGAPTASLRPAWRFGAAQLSRRHARSLAELVAFGLALTVLLLLTGVRHDLISTWRARLPANAPDHFIVNIQPGQRNDVQNFFATHGIHNATLYPMVRARLEAINGVPVAKWKPRIKSENGKELLLREQTLSMRAAPGIGNEVVAGHWWTKSDAGRTLVSVESDWAKTLDVGLGDRLEFSVADRRLTLTIASLREIKWQSFEPNFFMVTPPGTLDDYPATWITAIHAGAGDQLALALVHRFPNLTVINVDTILTAVGDLLRHAALALAAVFALALVAAVLVLLAALEAGRTERASELALMRVLGARRRLLAAILGAEFILLGSIAGIVAGLVSAGAGYALARWVFDIPAYFDGWLVLAGTLAGSLGIGGIGLAATLHLTRVPPLAALRRDA